MPITREKRTSVHGARVVSNATGRHAATVARAATDLRAAAMIGAVHDATGRREASATNAAAANDGSISGTVAIASANRGRLLYRPRR